jgi:hypothetical protein
MTLDPQITQLGVQLADVGVRNTVAGVSDRVRTAKARRQDQETINVLDEIINDLLADKNDLVQIARGYEQVLDAQRISQDEISYITECIIPVIKALAAAGDDAESADAIIDLLKPVLSVETITVLQLLGFNFKQAIGEPLTELVGRFIRSKAPMDAATQLDAFRAKQQREAAVAQIAKDPQAVRRFKELAPEE